MPHQAIHFSCPWDKPGRRVAKCLCVKSLCATPGNPLFLRLGQTGAKAGRKCLCVKSLCAVPSLANEDEMSTPTPQTHCCTCLWPAILRFVAAWRPPAAIAACGPIRGVQTTSKIDSGWACHSQIAVG